VSPTGTKGSYARYIQVKCKIYATSMLEYARICNKYAKKLNKYALNEDNMQWICRNMHQYAQICKKYVRNM
jgi:hypothetical protein